MTVDLTPALEILRREIADLVAVYLFGSAAAGTDRPDSDIDLAILAGQSPDRAQLLDVQEKIAQSLLRDVDLIDLTAVTTVLQMQAIGEGQLIDAPRPDQAALFEVRVMRDYQDLKRRRTEIDADIVQRGRVYAR